MWPKYLDLEPQDCPGILRRLGDAPWDHGECVRTREVRICPSAHILSGKLSSSLSLSVTAGDGVSCSFCLLLSSLPLLVPRLCQNGRRDAGRTTRPTGRRSRSEPNAIPENFRLVSELEAFSGVVSALRAQGELTKERRKVLNDLSNVLNISVERQKTEIRRAVNDEFLATVAKT